MVGKFLGPYKILKALGAGGMGQVYVATDTRLDRDVAIKVLPPGFAEAAQFLQRFEREAKVISQLNHPNVCTLFDVGTVKAGEIGEPSDVHYLVMELLEGESLAERLKKGPLPLHEVIAYGRQIASALDAAHRRQITHRDLKPDNVILTKSGAKLLDFGLAKTATEGPTPISGLTTTPTEAKPLTTEGMILGTFQYMAPEQLEGLEADARTDIFALGAVIYEMATGRRAFQGGSKTSLIAAIVASQPAPISSVVALSPPALDHVVRRCLEKDPDDRWQSAHDVASQLQWISEAGSSAGVAVPVTRRRKKRERLAWSVVALLSAITIAAVWLAAHSREGPAERPVIQASIVAPQDVTFRFVGLSDPPALSPDGKWIVFGGRDASRTTRIYARRLDSPKAVPIAGTEHASYPFWSPDSREIAFFSDGKLKKAAVPGGPVTTVCEVANGRGGTWSEDGTILVGILAKGLYRIPSGGGELTPVAKAKKGTGHRWPWMIPGTNRFVYLETDFAGHGSIRAGALDGSLDATIVASAANPAWADGHLLYTVGKTLMALKLDPDTLKPVGDPVPLADGVLYDPAFARSMFTVSNSGLLAYYTGTAAGKTVLTWFNRRGEKLGTLGKAEFIDNLDISPDGRLVAVAVRDAQLGSDDIWIYETNRDVRTRFTFDPSDERYMAWSKDGQTLFFHRNGTGTMRRPVSGARDAEKLTDNAGGPFLPGRMAPDGKTLLGGRWVGNTDIAAYPLGGKGGVRALLATSFNEYPLDFSPDGKYLLYASDESGRFEVYATTFPKPSGKWQVSVGGGVSARWSPDGKQILYLQRTPTTKILSVAVGSGLQDLGEPTVVLSLPDAPEDSFSWDLSPDGKRLLVTTVADPRRAIRSPITLVTNWTGLLSK